MKKPVQIVALNHPGKNIRKGDLFIVTSTKSGKRDNRRDTINVGLARLTRIPLAN